MNNQALPHPTTLIFDCFGVIFNEPCEQWFKSLALTDDEYNTLHQNIDKGDIGELTFNECCERLASSAYTAQDIRNAWNKIVEPNQSLINFIAANRHNYQIALLSNAIGDFIRPLFAKFNLNQYFDHIFISSELHLIKPDPNFFNLAISELNITPAQTLMIDDRKANIDAAKSIGMQGLLFHDTSDLVQYLKSKKRPQ